MVIKIYYIYIFIHCYSNKITKFNLYFINSTNYSTSKFEEVRIAISMRLFNKNKENQLFHIFKKAGDRYSEIYDHLNSVIELDTAGNLISFNQAFSKQYGYGEQDFKEPFLNVFIKNKSLEIAQYFEKAILGKTQRFNAVGLCKNGENTDINITLIPINKKTNRNIYVIIKNNSSIQKMERELLISQKKQEAFDDLEGICNFYYDAVNDFHYLSKQFPIVFGMNTDRNLPITLTQLLQYVHPDDRYIVKNAVQTALSEMTGYQIEYRVKRDQTIRYVYEQADILLDKNGYLDGLVGYIQDITNTKLSNHVLEKEKQLSQDL